jgi:hypothetical protein
MRPRAIRPLLAAALGAAVLGTGLASALLVGRVTERTMEGAAAESLRHAAGMFSALERGDAEKMGATIDAIVGREDLRDAFLERDRSRLQALAEPLFRVLLARDGITHWYFIEPSRECFLRVHRPDLYGDRIARATLARAAETGGRAVGKELGQTAFALRVVHPWTVEGRLIGFVELAEEIDHFLVRMKRETGNDFGLLVKKAFLDERAFQRVLGGSGRAWKARPDAVVVDTTTFTEGIIDFQGDLDAVPDAGLVLDEEVRDGRAWIRGIFPVRDAADRRVGALFVLHDFTAAHRALEAGRRRTMLAVLLLSLAGLALAWGALEWLLLARLRRAAARLEAAGAGPPAPGLDEVGRLERVAEELGGRGPARAPGEPPAG